MQILYKSTALKKECADFRQAQKRYGKQVAEKLYSAVEFIEASKSIVDIRDFRPLHFHELKGNKKGIFAIDLGRDLGYRLLVRPVDSHGNYCDNTVVFSDNAKSIIIVSLEEVTNHYE